MPVYNKRGILLLPKVIVLNPKDGSSKEKGTSTLINFPLEYQIVQINEDTMKKSD